MIVVLSLGHLITHVEFISKIFMIVLPSSFCCFGDKVNIQQGDATYGILKMKITNTLCKMTVQIAACDQLCCCVAGVAPHCHCVNIL